MQLNAVPPSVQQMGAESNAAGCTTLAVANGGVSELSLETLQTWTTCGLLLSFPE